MESEFLNNISKKGPLEIPEGYFGQLHGKIIGRVNGTNTHITRKNSPISEEHISIPGETSGLSAATTGTIFQVPPAYFDSLPARISSRINAGDLAGDPAGRADRYYKTAIAACIVLLLSIFSVVQVEKKNDPDNSIVNIADFDEEMLVQEYLESALTSSEDQAGELEQTGELERYILNQVDESLLLQEL